MAIYEFGLRGLCFYPDSCWRKSCFSYYKYFHSLAKWTRTIIPELPHSLTQWTRDHLNVTVLLCLIVVCLTALLFSITRERE